jgi:L-ascorbate 6-phosphate lactonase
MTALAREIRGTSVAAGTLAIWYLAQAGFCLKTSGGTLVYLDPYLSDCCHRLFGFQRMIPAVIAADELAADVLISTHAHADHLDPDALAAIAAHPATRFVGSLDCESVYAAHGVSRERCTLLRPGEAAACGEVTIRATYADHGDLAPDAIGVLIVAEGITVYDVGDSAFRPDDIVRSLDRPVDVMIAPINGAFGNLDAAEACRLAAAIRPRLLIASHFGMFVEHGGDPAQFLEAARRLPDGTSALVMAPGEKLVIRGA